MTPLDRHAPFPVLLAPMVGLTHWVVRKAIQEHLPAGRRTLWLTEMLNSRRIPAQSPDAQIETRFDDREAGLCPQLLGNEEGPIRDSITRLIDWGASAIDINMGCPVKRALKHNYGVSLMGDPDYAAEVVAFAVKHSSGLPISVKLRAAPPPQQGVAEDPEFLQRFCLKLEAAGASWLTLHPRTAVQKRRGDADWSQIAALKRTVRIPVIGNGDIQTTDDARRMLAETGCDRVMIGRALLAKPWMLSALVDPTQEPLDAYESGARYGRFLARVLELSREHYGGTTERLGARKFKFLVYHGSSYLEFGHTLYARVSGAETYDAIEQCLNDFFGERGDRPQRQSATTTLRG